MKEVTNVDKERVLNDTARRIEQYFGKKITSLKVRMSLLVICSKFKQCYFRFKRGTFHATNLYNQQLDELDLSTEKIV